MHGYSEGIQVGAENGAPNWASLGQPHVCPKGKEVPRDAVWHRNMSHAGRPRFPHDIQYRGGLGGGGDIGSSMLPPGGAAWDVMGDGRAQPDILRGRWEDRWEGPHLGTRRPDSISNDFPIEGTGDEPGED